MESFNYSANVTKLANLVFDAMMQQGAKGIYMPIIVCGVGVTCADDKQSVQNRFSEKMRRVDFGDIENAISYFEVNTK